MVNYCCVYGCGRNSRSNKHFNYYGLPKEKERREVWLKAAGREELLGVRSTTTYRFCSRHFAPNCIKKNRHLSPDAVPTLCLPGTWSEEEGESPEEREPTEHKGFTCNSCQDSIVGFCYRCLQCTNYDLCQKCEMLEVHSSHYMLRIPKPTKFGVLDIILKKCRKYLADKKRQHEADKDVTESAIEISSDSSDNEPITKYAISKKTKNYDSGIDISDDVKRKIKKEVSRMLKQKPKPKQKQKRGEKRRAEQNPASNKKMKHEEEKFFMEIESEDVPGCPEVAFADVNEIKDIPVVEFKQDTGVLPMAAEQFTQGSSGEQQQPVMHVKLSDDLSELMIEVTSNNQKTIYKYSDRNEGNT